MRQSLQEQRDLPLLGGRQCEVSVSSEGGPPVYVSSSSINAEVLRSPLVDLFERQRILIFLVAHPPGMGATHLKVLQIFDYIPGR